MFAFGQKLTLRRPIGLVRLVPLADSAIAEQPRFYRAEVGAGLVTYAADAV